MTLLERMLGEQAENTTKKKADIEYISEVEKFNPYHDSLGRFTTASGASSFTIRTRGGAYQQGMVNRAIEREKKRTASKNYKLEITGTNHKLPRLDSEQAERDRTDAIGKVAEKANVFAPFIGAKGKAVIDKEFEKYVSETDPKVWSRRAKLSRDDAWYDFKGTTREEAERKQRDLEAKRAEEKRKSEDMRNMRDAMERAKSANTKKAKEYREYQNELFNKYKDESLNGPEKYHYWTRATDAEKQKLRELEAALVKRDKNGKWRVAKSEGEFWDDDWEYTENNQDFQKSVSQNAGVDYIIELEKFNPYHDAKGRFANKHTFSTYSANPKTTAGSMAISRSYHGGHKRTLNVHAQSKGEDIGQNYRWITTGQKPNLPSAQNVAVQPRAKYGPNHPSNVGKPHKNNLAQQKQNTSEKPTRTGATGRQIADGKDLTNVIKQKNINNPLTLNDIAEVQGYKNKGEVVTDKKEFMNAVERSGIMMYRTVSPGRDVADNTKKTKKTAEQFISEFKNSDNISYNGTGGQAFGSGIYTASNPDIIKGQKPNVSEQKNAMLDSASYGIRGAKTIAMTLDPSAKVADYHDVMNEFLALPDSEQSKYRDIGVYVAAKGFDAMKVPRSDGLAYTVVYNRNALIIFDAVAEPNKAVVAR